MRIGGYLVLDDAARETWCWSGAWTWPVGDPLDRGAPGHGGVPGFERLRGIGAGGRGHQGADLGNGRGGDTVRAAAHGRVVRVVARRWTSGYGRHVVLAHRLAEGGIVYSVYAHLGPGGPFPREGDAVRAGQPIGVVGRSGRASTDHLHFEVRRPRDEGARWEHAAVLDPLAFVAARLPVDPGPGWPAPYLLWGAAADLVPAGTDPDGALDRETWWRMLWRSARHPLDEPPDDPRALRASLVEVRVLDEDKARPRGALTWEELARDLERLRQRGVRLPPAPAGAAELGEVCERELEVREPARHPRRLGARHDHPTLALALLALADLAAGAGP